MSVRRFLRVFSRFIGIFRRGSHFDKFLYFNYSYVEYASYAIIETELKKVETLKCSRVNRMFRAVKA